MDETQKKYHIEHQCIGSYFPPLYYPTGFNPCDIYFEMSFRIRQFDLVLNCCYGASSVKFFNKIEFGVGNEWYYNW